MYDSDTVTDYAERTEDTLRAMRMCSRRTTNVTRELVFFIGRRAHHKHSMLIKIKVCKTGGQF